MKLKGGIYSGGYNITSPAYMEITGGRYTVDPTPYLAEGYRAEYSEGDHDWIVAGPGDAIGGGGDIVGGIPNPPSIFP